MDKYLYFEKANECYLANNLIEALKYINKSIEIDPDFALAYCTRGVINSKNGDYSEAINDGNLAKELIPNSIEPLIALAEIYYDKGNYSTAIEYCNIAIELNPNFSEAYQYIGMSYSKLGNNNAAFCNFNKAIEINPFSASAYNRRGLFYLKLRDSDRSLYDFQKAIELDPKNETIYFNIAVLYFNDQDYQSAFEYIVIAEELSENKSHLFSKSDFLLNFFHRYNAPFFLFRLIKHLDTLDSFISYQKLIAQNLKECSEIVTLFDYLEDTKLIEINTYYLLKGVITYYLNDPAICYHIFNDKIDGKISNTLMLQYYLVLSSLDYLKSDPQCLLKNSLEKVKIFLSELNDDKIDFIQLYYAGQIFFLNEKYINAIECFNKIPDFIPALCMQIICYDSLDDSKNRNLLIKQLIFLDKNNRGLLSFASVPNINLHAFEETVVKYAFTREIEPVISILNDYSDLTYDLYHNSFPIAIDVFSLDKNSIDGNKTNENIKLWKQDVVNSFCSRSEKIFSKKIKDHFEQWNQETDQNKLAMSLGSEIPLLHLKEELKINIIDLIDYYYVKNKISDEERYLLIYWNELYKYRNRKLSLSEKKVLNLTLGYLLKILFNLTGIEIISNSFFNFIGEQSTEDFLVAKIITFIDVKFIKTNNAVPEFFVDFRKQFIEYLNKEKNNL